MSYDIFVVNQSVRYAELIQFLNRLITKWGSPHYKAGQVLETDTTLSKKAGKQNGVRIIMK